MEKECEQQLLEITEGFKVCQKALVAIGDETRQSIIITLLEHFDGIRVGEIASHTHLSRPAVSHHLQVLKEAGIINMRRVGTRNYYYLDANESNWKPLMDLVKTIYMGIQDVGVDDPRKREE